MCRARCTVRVTCPCTPTMHPPCTLHRHGHSAGSSTASGCPGARCRSRPCSPHAHRRCAGRCESQPAAAPLRGVWRQIELVPFQPPYPRAGSPPYANKALSWRDAPHLDDAALVLASTALSMRLTHLAIAGSTDTSPGLSKRGRARRGENTRYGPHSLSSACCVGTARGAGIRRTAITRRPGLGTRPRDDRRGASSTGPRRAGAPQNAAASVPAQS